MAPQTSNKNTSGKAKSPRTESRASAKSSGFFLFLPASTMVVAAEKCCERLKLTSNGVYMVHQQMHIDNKTCSWVMNHGFSLWDFVKCNVFKKCNENG